MKKLAIAASLMAILGTAHAYQTEVGADYTMIDPDFGDSTNSFGIDGTYYINPVKDNNAPLAEAAFMNKASNVGLRAEFADNKVNDATSLTASGEYYVPNTDFYAAASVGTTDYDKSDNDTNYGIKLGYFVAPNFRIAAGIAGTKNNGNNNSDPILEAKYVTRVGAHDWNFEAGGRFGDNDAYNVAADFYVDNTFSIGGIYSNVDSPAGDTDTFGLRARKFFNQQVSVAAELGFGDNEDSYGLRGTYRF